MPDRQPTDNLIQVLQHNLRDLLRGGDIRNAAEVLERLQDEAPLELETRALHLEFLLKSRRLEEAESLALQLLELYPTYARLQYLAGLAAYRRKDYVHAVRRWEESRRIRPDWRTERWLSKALSQTKALDDAEALLLPLCDQHPICLPDLAWVYERRGDTSRALETLESALKHTPDSKFVLERMRRLRAKDLSPNEIQEEMALMEELGETPDPEMIPAYVDSLLATGQGARARDYVQAQQAAWTLEEKRQSAWNCHHRQAYDLAFPLFLELFQHERGNYKYLGALEKAARLGGRLDQLIKLYEAQAPDDARLYGRLKKLRTWPENPGG